jgi:acetyl-CoA carboxylase alpha subunit
MFHRTEGEEEQEIGLLYSELSAEVERLEAAGLPVPADFREALKMMESAKEFRPLA